MGIHDAKRTVENLGLGKRVQKRSVRVADAIQRELSELLIKDTRDPQLADVYITRVEVTDDLKIARIFFSVFGEQQRAAKVEQILRKAAGYMRSHIARTVNMRFTPSLQFRYDTTVQKLDELEQIFRDIERERKQRDADS